MRKAMLSMAAGIASVANAESGKIAPSLERQIEQAKPGQMAEVIVQFEKEPGAAEAETVKALGGKQIRMLPSVRMGIFLMPLAKVKQLAGDKGVRRIAPNQKVAAQNPGKSKSGKVLVEGEQ